MKSVECPQNPRISLPNKIIQVFTYDKSKHLNSSIKIKVFQGVRNKRAFPSEYIYLEIRSNSMIYT